MTQQLTLKSGAANRSPAGETLKGAAIAAIVTIILTAPILGLQLKLDGYKVVLEQHWRPVWIATAIVFVFQLIKPMLVRSRRAIRLPAMPTMGRRQQLTAMWVLLAVGLVWPFVGSRGAVDVATLALIYCVLGLGLNIVVGFAGLLDLGYVGFYAVGGYTYALLNQYFGLTFWECLPLAALMSATFGFLLGFPVLRLRGDYLAIVTLGFGEIIRLMLNNLTSLTGGPDGVSGIPKPSVFGFEMARSSSVEGVKTFHELIGLDYSGSHMVIWLYLLAFALVGFTLFVTSRLIRMPIGRAWEALREDEIACRSLCLNPTRMKLSANSALSAAIRMSHMRERSQPAPTANPFTAAIDGTSRSYIASGICWIP